MQNSTSASQNTFLKSAPGRKISCGDDLLRVNLRGGAPRRQSGGTQTPKARKRQSAGTTERKNSGTQEQKNGGAKQRRRIFYVRRILSRRTQTGALFGKKRGGAPVPDPRKTGFSPRLRFPALPRRRLHFINLRRRSYFFAVCGGKASVTRMRVERRRTARRCEKAEKPYSP